MNRQKHSAFQEDNVFFACGIPIIVAENAQRETHVYRASDRVRLSETDLKGGVVYGGSREGDCDSTAVTMESGLLERLHGGSENGMVHGSIEICMAGGVITDSLYGAGVNDTVQDVTITVSGGVIKKRCVAGGEARRCGDITMNLNRIICTNLYTGVCGEHGIHQGSARVNMAGGVILNLYCGGTAPTEGSVEVTITDGYLEKQVIPCEVKEGIRLRLYEGILQSGGYDIVFPKIPEEIPVEWFPSANEHQSITRYKEMQDGFYDVSGEKGKLVCRFFEVRDPNVPKYTARFPQFIGDCIFVHFPNGMNMLIDTGLSYAAQEVLDGLRKLGIDKLDYLHITHMHYDHMDNAVEIMRKFPVGKLILPKVHTVLPLDIYKQKYIDLLEAAERYGVPLWRVMKGDSMTVGTGKEETLIEFLNPMEGWTVEKDLNRASIAMKMTYGDTSVMFGGDITNEIEKSLSTEYGDKLACDLLKLSHHGIVEQGHYTYIDACAPKYVVVHNLREEGVFITATRYQLNHIHGIPDEQIYVTGICGRIKATLTGEKDGIQIETQYRL